MTRRQRMITWSAIIGAHAAILGALLISRIADQEPAADRALMVSFVAEAAAPAPEPVPQPPPPAPPRPAPLLVTTPKPSMSAIVAPPVEDLVVPDIAPAPADHAPAEPADAAPAAAITAPDFSAAYLNNPGPKYPYSSRRRREEGVVMLKVLVGADGKPEQVIVDKSSGFAALDGAAADVVRGRWRFVPAKEGDRAVAAWVAIPMSFTLTNN
ncbi:energy transducer TonB [Emcibacter sp. SYSU 3D8]|uniref:energy transducer TonB n=1 Tax=Emcibacter sp. SYSU 3D8 TaxID=3133969 RepID=UPI0031FE5E88